MKDKEYPDNVIPFPKQNRKADKLLDEIDAVGAEIELCLADIDDLNGHILELSAGYEQLLAQLCAELGTDIDTILEKYKSDSER